MHSIRLAEYEWGRRQTPSSFVFASFSFHFPPTKHKMVPFLAHTVTLYTTIVIHCATRRHMRHPFHSSIIHRAVRHWVRSECNTSPGSRLLLPELTLIVVASQALFVSRVCVQQRSVISCTSRLPHRLSPCPGQKRGSFTFSHQNLSYLALSLELKRAIPIIPVLVLLRTVTVYSLQWVAPEVSRTLPRLRLPVLPLTIRLSRCSRHPTPSHWPPTEPPAYSYLLLRDSSQTTTRQRRCHVNSATCVICHAGRGQSSTTTLSRSAEDAWTTKDLTGV